MRRPTSATCHQSGRACPGAVRTARWREIVRSEFVTVPSFSAQAVAGSSTSASLAVSVAAVTSETTVKAQVRIASRTASASGMVAAGFVCMIQSARMRPSATARNMSTAFRPGRSGIRGASQKARTAERCIGSSRSRWQASMLASPPTSRPPIALGCPVTENGPIPGRPIRPVAMWQFRMAFTLSVPAEDWFTPWLKMVTTRSCAIQSRQNHDTRPGSSPVGPASAQNARRSVSSNPSTCCR